MKQWMLTAILVISGVTLFTACTSDDDNLGPDTKKLVGQWTADVTGATQVLWGDGKALRMTELNSGDVLLERGRQETQAVCTQCDVL